MDYYEQPKGGSASSAGGVASTPGAFAGGVGGAGGVAHDYCAFNFIKEVERLKLEPGDILLIQTSQSVTEQQAQAVREVFRQALEHVNPALIDKVNALVYDGQWSFSVVKTKDWAPTSSGTVTGGEDGAGGGAPPMHITKTIDEGE